jgi:hypothetical protein
MLLCSNLLHSLMMMLMTKMMYIISASLERKSLLQSTLRTNPTPSVPVTDGRSHTSIFAFQKKKWSGHLKMMPPSLKFKVCTIDLWSIS